MTVQEWLAIAGVLAALMLGLPLFRWLCERSGASAEASRKSVHVAMGLACAAFPWIFDRPLPVWILAALATLPLLLLRCVPALRSGLGSTLHGVKRVSYGEILFAPAVAAVFDLSNGDTLLHVIPVGILTVADAAGAIAGTKWGHRFYACGTGRKSAEGSAAFLVVAFLCAFLPLILTGRVDASYAVWIALTLAVLSMMAEGISDRGFDNLIIPLGCHFILARLLASDMPHLITRFTAAVILLGIVTAGARHSTLSGSSLIGGALLGYGCAILADPRFTLPPLAIFFSHLITTRRHKLTGVFDHRLDAVISHAIGCLSWSLAVNLGWIDSVTGLCGVSFAMAVQLAMADVATQTWLHSTKPQLLRATIKGWLVGALPGLIWLWQDAIRIAPVLAIVLILTPVACLLSHWIESRYAGSPTRLWMIKGTLSFLASTPALLLR
ncbi:hypothetical protein [Luteolibacter luteus]|uniref:Phytol kinase n=1 Tax=Luteolibacter luteus TaxID=2728835 RepID=A0A858REJ4_9BACT|nr:hypothetical protein [Luteolibacter luteus]QJE94583.1 hypothetical protein HHL09_01890 [Luteolibacter luteus]